MKTNFFLLAILLLSTLSCNDKANKDDTASALADDQKLEITAKAIENFKFEDYSFSREAEDIVTTWNRYQELATQISYLRRADITFFTGEKDTIKVFLDSMRANIPKTINTEPINARLSVLETTVLKLNNELSLDNYPSEKKLKSIKELLVANSNLIYLINKKLEYDKNNVSRPADNSEN